MSLAKALLAFQGDAPPVHLDATNPHFKNKYASLGGVVEAIRPVLNKHGIVYTQLPTTHEGRPALLTVLIHADSGERMESTMLLLLDRENSQGQGSALTYARRYALLSVLGLVGDEDDDATAATSKPKRSMNTAKPKDAPSAAQRKQLDDVIAELTDAKPDMDWAAGADKYARREFGHGVGALSVPELEQTVAAMRKHLDTIRAAA